MASLKFFAAYDDFVALFAFLFEHTDARVFDLYSKYGEELSEYCSIEELKREYPFGTDPYGKGESITLCLWSPSVMQEFPIRRITLNPKSCGGHTFRYTLEGGGLMQLYLGGTYEDIVTLSYFGHHSFEGARTWGIEAGVEWSTLSKLSHKILYHLRRRIAVTKVDSRPVLPQAYALARQGYKLAENPGIRWYYDLPDIPGKEAVRE
jgi:hypothetical protein